MITKPATPGEHPMPGDTINGDSIVIASVISREDDGGDPIGWTLLMLNPFPPYYMVGTGEWHDEIFVWEETHDHVNIVPAVNGDRSNGTGYVDMGGDY